MENFKLTRLNIKDIARDIFKLSQTDSKKNTKDVDVIKEVFKKLKNIEDRLIRIESKVKKLK